MDNVQEQDRIKETRKIIKIGNSYGISIPKKELESRGIVQGDEVLIDLGIEKKKSDYSVSAETMNLIENTIQEYETVLERLADYDAD